MSIRHMVQVWEYSNQRGTALLMLLAIADYANQDGLAWPSLESLAAKCRLSYDQVYRLVHKLAAQNELQIIERQGRSNLYKLPPAPTRGVADSTPRADAGTPPAPTRDTPRAHAGTPPAPTRDDPLINHHELQPSIEPVLLKLTAQLDREGYTGLVNRLDRAEAAELLDDTLVIRIASDSDRAWLRDRATSTLQNNLVGYLGRPIKVEFV